MGDELDVEHLIEEIDRICGARTSLRAIGYDAASLESAEKVRTEVEWFVQHAAERVTPKDAHLMWGSVLRATETNDITFVTTNYDRAIEIAANIERIDLVDGFAPLDNGERARWTGFGYQQEGSKLVKLHGSTDWFADHSSGDPMKLRHPMALFGKATLRFEELELGSALVLPSREKLLTKSPYPRLSQEFLNAADQCELALFVGSSLRDDHIRNAAQSIVDRVPVFIANPKGDDQGINGASAILEHASTFLVSTLPNALNATDSLEFLRNKSGKSSKAEQGIFSVLKDLLDENVESNRRCRAAETLHEFEVTLVPNLIEQVLGDDDPTLGRYALGLIPYSTSHQELIEMAANSDHTSNPAFLDELEVLRLVV